MELNEMLEELAGGEQTTRQFKLDITNPAKLAAEIVAFSNSAGGKIFIGVDDDGVVRGLDDAAIRRLNQLVSSAASQRVIPPVNPLVENVVTERGIVMVLTIPYGINKPYQDKDGVFWVKSGADKRRATSREELQRLFQSSLLVHADETLVPSSTLSDLNRDYLHAFLLKRFGEMPELPEAELVRNLNLGDGIHLNLTGLLLFGRAPSIKLPAFIVKAGAFAGTDLSAVAYDDSTDITGRLADVYQQTINFIMSNLHHPQGHQSVNSLGVDEIPRIVFEELVANALIHRDYFISAPVRVFVFADRVEIISPGHLPNNLTIDNIKCGNTNSRNPVLASFANHLITYRGFGGGIIRACRAYDGIELVDDRAGNLFKATIARCVNS